FLGNFDYRATPQNELTLTLNSSPAHTQIANRAGLPDSFASVGQGFGYGGALSAADAAAAGIVSQQDAGQDIGQRDANQFGVLNWRHTYSPRAYSLFSVGLVRSGQDITNNSPALNLQ